MMDTQKETSLAVAVTVIEKVEHQLSGEIVAAGQRIASLRAEADMITVSNAGSESEATRIAVDAKTLLKNLETKQAQTAGVLGTWARKLNAQFKPSSDSLDSVIKLLGKKVGDYKNALESARQAEIRANAAKIEAEEKRLEAEKKEAAKEFLEKQQVAKAFGDAEAATLAAVEFKEVLEKKNIHIPEVVDKKTSVSGGTASVKPSWDFEVIDESLIPRNYLMPDLSKIRIAVKAEVDIPGVRRFQKMTFGRINLKKGA